MSTVLDAIGENRLLNGWARWLAHSPEQLNAMHESDAELFPMPGGDELLALTVDTVAEEIALGFYRTPETAGWVAAMASLSDLAAVAATPIGVLVSVTMPARHAHRYQRGLAQGLDAACRAAGTFVLGGDTNFGRDASITTCAAGWVRRDAVQSRLGCRPGELLYVSGLLGGGSVAAARAIFELPPELEATFTFRPVARLREARLLSGFATSVMDTSDGLITTLDQLSRLNGVGFSLQREPEEMLTPHALAASRWAGVDPLVMLAAQHGEFELAFTVPAAARARFEQHARQAAFFPLCLGRVISEPVIRVEGERPRELDGACIRNLFEEVGGDLRRYLRELGGLVSRSPKAFFCAGSLTTSPSARVDRVPGESSHRRTNHS